MRRGQHRSRIALPALALLVLCACDGGIHKRGRHQLALTGSFGTAIKGETVWQDGHGRADNAAATLGYNYFLRDRGALMLALTPARVYNQSDRDVLAGEYQMGFRYYFWEFDLLDAPVGLFGEILGGIMYGARSIPEEGSNFNFTQDTGVGFEWQLGDNVSWISGYRFRHLSNGRLFNDDNPAQNDHHVYTGVAFTLP